MNNTLRRILELELRALQDRITSSANTKFVFQCSDAVKEMLLREGIDYKYGARPLKRSIDRLLLLPLSNLVATEQVTSGDAVYVDLNDSGSDVEFSKRYDDRPMSDAAVAALAAEYAGFVGAPAQSQLIGATV
jgi:ATP-dependent Clp protease ATP-binding subunit ClpA